MEAPQQQLDDNGFMYRMMLSFAVYIGILVVGAFLWPSKHPQKHYDSPLLRPRVITPIIVETKVDEEPVAVEPISSPYSYETVNTEEMIVNEQQYEQHVEEPFTNTDVFEPVVCAYSHEIINTLETDESSVV